MILVAIGLFIGVSIGFIFAAILVINRGEDTVGLYERTDTSPSAPHPSSAS